MNESSSPATIPVLSLRDIDADALRGLLTRYGLTLEIISDTQAAIPGSFWGDSEAGLIDNRLLARGDTPLHSILHEACHYVCMDGTRRDGLHTNAGGDYDEENGVCYLQILLADQLPNVGHERLLQDMDVWGYSFRLGSTARWFNEDAEDAHAWLIHFGIIDTHSIPTWNLRH